MSHTVWTTHEIYSKIQYLGFIMEMNKNGCSQFIVSEKNEFLKSQQKFTILNFKIKNLIFDQSETKLKNRYFHAIFVVKKLNLVAHWNGTKIPFTKSNVRWWVVQSFSGSPPQTLSSVIFRRCYATIWANIFVQMINKWTIQKIVCFLLKIRKILKISSRDFSGLGPQNFLIFHRDTP